MKGVKAADDDRGTISRDTLYPRSSCSRSRDVSIREYIYAVISSRQSFAHRLPCVVALDVNPS